MIDRVRTFAGYREYPKYGIVRRTFVYKQAFVREAERLVHADVLRAKEDSFFLRFPELGTSCGPGSRGHLLIPQRQEAFTGEPLARPGPGAHLRGRGHHRRVPAGGRGRTAR